MAQGRGSSESLGVVSVTDESVGDLRPEVVHEHINGDRRSRAMAIDTLNSFDVVSVQHEYGIYGGPDGDEIVELMTRLAVPTVVTLHTVLSRPTEGQRSVLEQVGVLADAIVVMSETARARLVNGYKVDPAKVRVIPHGARISLNGPSLASGARPVLLTWGLIGPGKGLELVVDALAELKDLRPRPRYIILGETHPKVRAAHGDSYLEQLVAHVHALGLDDVVEFDGRYLDIDALTVAVRQADAVVLPYESTEQVTSGVLVEAIGAGKPVVATAFPHAVEMLASGAGIVVPHANVGALADALRQVLTDPAAAQRMAEEAQAIGSTLYWPVVAGHYESLILEAIARARDARTFEGEGLLAVG
jgi:glycosyltransferase involved in cell wall biosynthesis